MNNIVDHHRSQLLSYRQRYPIQRWVVAYSGGVDSTVLLHSLITANQQCDLSLPIIALHINHQLSEHANDWQQHCQALCDEWGVHCHIEPVVINASGSGVEAAARAARYQVFENYLVEGDGLLLGHHQHDQSETVLLRMLRGAGVNGLAAMPVTRALGVAQLFRPLLSVTKSMVTDYAKQQGLQWVEDDSNHQDTYDRNFLRNQVTPLLEQRWPALHRQLTQQAERMRQSSEVLNEVAESDLAGLGVKTERMGFSVDNAALSLLSVARRNNVLRHWCESLGFAVPHHSHLCEIEEQVFSVTFPSTALCVTWGHTQLRHFAGRLYLMRKLPTNDRCSAEPIEWSGEEDIDLGARGYIKLLPNTDSGGLKLPKKTYTIRWRKGGERCTPSNRAHSQTLKKLLQEHDVETWLRDRVPLFYDGEHLAAVGDLWVNKGYEVKTHDAPSLVIRWGLISMPSASGTSDTAFLPMHHIK